MKVFMLGWEFPPFISGGLGTACYGLTKALDQIGVKVTFVLPKSMNADYASHVRLLTPGSKDLPPRVSYKEFKNVTFRPIQSTLRPYQTPATRQEKDEQTRLQKQLSRIVQNFPGDNAFDTNYDGDMYSAVYHYAAVAAQLSRDEDFDVIHAHDWMTFPAAIAAAATTKKPLLVHVHSTEFDRSGEHVNQQIYDIERQGMVAADKVIAVSKRTRNIIIERYGIDPEKVDVVHNGIQRKAKIRWTFGHNTIEKDERIVLFMGRITMQKGPEYFLRAAKKVLQVTDKVKFVMAGSGDLMNASVELAAQLGIGQKVLFTGFLRGESVQKIYQMADLFVMPSVSEPFGLVPLEALDNDVPVIISKQSGISEVIKHALKVDFWDIDEMANKVVAVLKYPALRTTLRNYGNFEVRKLRWKDAAIKCLRAYHSTLMAG